MDVQQSVTNQQRCLTLVPPSSRALKNEDHGSWEWESDSYYWAQDRWEARDPFFDQFERPGTTWNSRATAHITFTYLPPGIRDEVKRYLAHSLQNHRLRLSTAFGYSVSFRLLAAFLAERYPTAQTLGALPMPEAPTLYRQFMMQKNRTYRSAGNLFRQVLLFVNAQSQSDTPSNRPDTLASRAPIDEGFERFSEDRWDIRSIPGAAFTRTSSAYWLSFAAIPAPFRVSAKHYIWFRLNCGISQNQCYADIRGISSFSTFIHSRHPEWLDLTALTRADVEAFLAWFRAQWAHEHVSSAQSTKPGGVHYLRALRSYLAYIERAQRPEAPTTPSALLWWRGDVPPDPQPDDATIRYIPEGVLQQLEAALERLQPAMYIPIVILLRASGWRISDILNLRYDTCLERTGLGWYLHGDIVKTRVLNHRVPVTDEVAAVVQAVAEETKARSAPESNPERLLFVRLDGPRRGLPPQGAAVAQALNRLAALADIVDDQGALFHFGNHAFRHTKAVELINNGMNLLHVQKWLAHYSPEMTLRYARILDETLRQAWVEATKGGIFRLDGVGGVHAVNLEELANEDHIEWAYIRTHLDAVRMPNGYCFKPLKQPCPTQDDPCYSCRNFCTTVEFLPDIERQIAGIKTVIAEGQARGRVIWVQKNEAKVKRLEPIAEALREQSIHHPAGKRAREYIGDEREQLEKSLTSQDCVEGAQAERSTQ